MKKGDDHEKASPLFDKIVFNKVEINKCDRVDENRNNPEF